MNYDLAGWRARLSPQRPALWFNGHWDSYADLDARAERLAAKLFHAGVRAGDRVAVVALNHLVHVDLILAAPKLGCVYTPFNHRLSEDETRELAQHLRPACVFVDSRNEARAAAFDCAALPLAEYRDWLAEGPALDYERAEPQPDDTHMILFTGGSTGRPKGAMLPYRQTYANACATALTWGLTENDCAIQATPAFHAAVNVLSLPLWYLGGRVVWMPQFDTGAYLELVAAHGATVAFMVPTMYQSLADDARFDRAELGSLRWAISGGAPCPAPVRARYKERGVRFKQGYGLTEAGVNCFAIELDDAEAHPDSVGKPMPQLQAVIRHPDGSACAPGQTGELTLAGDAIFSGYCGQPRETAHSLRDGWLWTGDLFRIDEHGLYHVAGRRKEMYISGGENVYPAEVEAALYQLDGIVEAAVLGVPDAQWGETGLAVVVLREGAEWERESLRKALRAKLAAYKVPTEFLFMENLPKTAAGKLQKPVLRELYEELRAESQAAAG